MASKTLSSPPVRSFDILFAMVGKRAVLVLSPEWLNTSLCQFVSEGDAKSKRGLLVIIVDVLETDNAHGLFVKSTLKERIGDSEIFIPWKYVEGIVWNDDPNISRRFGFSADEANE
jgi:hypothetical protein